jgi:hypothetical protein
MRKTERYKGYVIDVEASKTESLWTWVYWLGKHEGGRHETFLPEGPKAGALTTADGALNSAIANGKKRIDNGFTC